MAESDVPALEMRDAQLRAVQLIDEGQVDKAISELSTVEKEAEQAPT
jgi:hypothetical protein